MSESPLTTHAGPIAAAAGGLFAVVSVGFYLVTDRSDLVAMMTNPAFLLFSAAYAVSFPLLLIALIAVYGRQAGQAGVFGAVAFCTAVVGTTGLAGDMWFEAFAMPWLTQVAPQVIGVPSSGSLLRVAWLVSVVLFSLGWMLFGAASWRARVLPRGLSIGVAAGGLLGFQAAMPPWGVALGLAVAAVGIWLIRHDRIVGRVRGASTRRAGRRNALPIGTRVDVEDRRSAADLQLSSEPYTRKVHHVLTSHPRCLERASAVAHQRTTPVQPYSGLPGGPAVGPAGGDLVGCAQGPGGSGTVHDHQAAALCPVLVVDRRCSGVLRGQRR